MPPGLVFPSGCCFVGIARAVILATTVAGFVPGGTAAAADTDLASVVGKIEAAYQAIRNLKAAFTQETAYEGFGKPFTSKGVLYIQRPGQMRWDYREPSRHQIYVNGNEVIYVVPEHQQAIRSTMDREVGSSVPLGLLSGAARLSEEFSVAWDADIDAGEGHHRLRLTGKSKTAGLAPISIEVNDRFLIRHVTLQDPSGAKTTFEFSDLILNKGLDAGLFTFTPSPGIELVDAPPLLPEGLEHRPTGAEE
jgi:outer membrane lipoprotein carrier protein